MIEKMRTVVSREIPSGPQKELSQERFEEHIKNIEKIFNKDVSRKFQGRTIFYLLDDVFNQSFFVNTTFQDICEFTSHDRFLWMDRSYDIENFQIHGLWKPKKREFGNVLKATPPNTFAYYKCMFCQKNELFGEYVSYDSVIPVRQKTNWINEECKKTFTGQPDALTYDEIMGNSIEFLSNNKALSIGPSPQYVKSKRDQFDTSYAIQKGIARIYEAVMSWGICYDWNGICFVIPMEREYILSILKNRDKYNGRRPLLPRLVREYTRKNGTTVARHISAGVDPEDENIRISMNGRNYAILLGGEIYDAYLRGSKKVVRYHKTGKLGYLPD